jgi:hypothetical protein
VDDLIEAGLVSSDYQDRKFNEAVQYGLATYGPEVVAAAVEQLNAEDQAALESEL